MNEDTDIKALEAFILHNPELDHIEGLLRQFNAFETLNAAYAEVRHSNVLAWLLNPNANHGLGEHFDRQFLKSLASTNRQTIGSRMSLFDVEFLDYGDVEIRREWNNIDLLMIITEDEHSLILVVENKIKSSEHSDQLRR